VPKVKTSPVAASVPFDNDSNGFTAQDTQTAIEEAKQNAEGFPRAGARSSYNGTVANNDWLGPNELLSNTPLLVSPVTLRVNEITWANSNSNVAFRIEFRTVSKTGTIFYTLTVTSPNSGSGFVTGVNFDLPPGTTVWAQYKDDGTNAQDLDIIIWVSRVS
jgi:hypothetical protein